MSHRQDTKEAEYDFYLVNNESAAQILIPQAKT